MGMLACFSISLLFAKQITMPQQKQLPKELFLKVSVRNRTAFVRWWPKTFQVWMLSFLKLGRSITLLLYSALKPVSYTHLDVYKRQPKAQATTNSDSLKNWLISCERTDPTALRIPTSLARFSERAVLKFIKLMQANNSTKTPMMVNSQTYWIRPSNLSLIHI